ncbi:MAG: DUF177 domain-containing protein [Bacteroidales bacterium]|nr:DUF177 domain-containing protein [Bacteroidales bacterium]
MGKFDAFKLPLKSLSVGSHEYEYQLDTNWFTLIDGPEVSKGNVHAKVTVNNTGFLYEVLFRLDGVVEVPCDRCLEDMPLAIEQESRLIVKFGPEYAEESEEVIIIPETDGELNIAWFLYEIIALAVPLKHVHPPGKCNKAMSSKLRKHLAKSMDDEEDEDAFLLDEDFPEEVEETETNPVWDELKKLKDLDNN